MSQSNKVSGLRKKDDDVEEIEVQESTISQAISTSEEAGGFDIIPMRKTCSYCNINIVTYVEHEVNPLFLIGALFTFLIFGLLSFIILPIAYMLTKNAVHRCSRCLQRLGEKQCFGLPQNFSEEIWHFKLGKCSIVMARGYAIALLMTFAILSGYYVYLRPSYFTPLTIYEHPTESKEITTTWDQFLKDCGGEVIVENFVHARGVFNKKYENNIVEWDGYFADSKITTTLPYFTSDHAINVLVKMVPTESSVYPDLVLSVSTDLLKRRKTLFNSVKKGDHIRFRATIQALGNEFKMHHLHALDIEMTGTHKELSEIIVRESALP